MAGKLLGTAIESGTITSTQLSNDLNNSISSGGGGGPKIISLVYPGDDTAANTTGGQTIYINGSGFQQNVAVYVNNAAVPAVSFISSSNISFTTPALSARAHPLYVVNTDDGGTAILVPGLEISGEPTWNTAAGSLSASQDAATSWNYTVEAISDSSVTYALADGSSLPSGVTLASNGLISGTISSPPDVETTYNFSVVASDAENQDATRTFSVTVTTGEGVLFADTVLLIHADGTNNQNNNVFLDSSNNNFTITRNGNVTQGSFSPFSQTGWSNYFDGTGDYLVSPSSANAEFNPANGFTVEGWVRPESTGTFQFVVSSVQGTGSFESWWFIGITSGGNWRVSYGGASAVDTNTAVTFNSWSHVALSSTGTNTKFFLNGVQIGSVNVNQQNANMNLTFGNYSGTTQFVFKGHMSNFRYVKGTALYTEAFTPSTTPLQPIANTSLLTCQSNEIVDEGPNNFAITRNGDVSVQPYSPFAPTSAYSTTNVGGSGYFDGNGDFLSVPYSEELSLTSVSNFTIECWIYLTATPPNNTSIIRNRPSTGGTGYDLRIDTSRNIMFYYTNGSQITTTQSISLNQWTHVAFVRNASTGSIYLNGVLNVTGSFSDGSTSTEPSIIGRSQLNHDLTGYISNLRVLSGTSLYASNFTPPSAPLTNIANTSLLLNFTNAGIFDQTTKNVLETFADAKVSTAQYKYGTGSMFFDGTGDYVTAPASVAAFGTGDFTIEGWFYMTALGNGVFRNTTSTSSGTIPGVSVYVGTNGSMSVSIASSAASGILLQPAAGTISVNTWHHIAITRRAGACNVWVDGVSVASGTTTNNLNTGVTLRIGEWRNASEFYTGYIDDFRISRFARYTSAFTPPTSAFNDK